MFCIGLNKFRCPSPQRNRTKFPDRSDREASLSPDDPHSSKTADSRRRERAGIHSSPADHAPPKPDRAFRPFRPRHRCPDRPCADEACRPPSPVRFDLSPMHRASAFAPHGFAGPAARSREKTGSLPSNDRIVPSTGMRPFTETSSFRPPLRTGAISERLLAITPNLFPTNPTAKASVVPKTDAHPHANVPQKPKGNGPAIRLPSNDVLRRLPLLRNHPPEYIFTGQLSDKQERKTSEGGQNRHRNTPPTLPRTGSRNSVQKSRNTQLQRAKKTAGQNCESQHTEPRFPKRIFASCRSRSSRVKREFRIRPPSCPQCCDCTQNGKGKPALRRTVVRRSPPPFSARFHPRSPAFACSPALSPEKRNDAGSEVGNDAPHGRKTSVTLLPAPHSPSTFFPHSVPGFPVLTAALARMPTRQVYTPMDRGLCLPSSSPTAGSPGSKPCKHPDRRPPPRRGIETVISESAARRVFRRHVRTCRRNRPRPGPKPSPGNGPPRKMRK